MRIPEAPPDTAGALRGAPRIKESMPVNEINEKISESELEIMQLLWHSAGALPLSEIRKSLQKSVGWEATTIKTLLQRLVSKRAVLQEKRGVFYYSPLVSEEEYNNWATEKLLKRLYHGRARDLAAALVNAEELTKDDIDELRKMFRVEE